MVSMIILLLIFLGSGSFLWLSVFGYILVLSVINRFRRPLTVRDISVCPEIAVVIPSLDEEDMILAKLADLRRTDYPHDRITIVVVDGGSSDRTTSLIRKEIGRGEPVQLISVNESIGRSNQIIHALGLLRQDIVVVTDVDSVLEPSCIRELVKMLEQDSRTAIIGATVKPNSALLEERIHWWILNYLWWLEGEVLSSAGVSGVCYACRREVVLKLAREARARNIRLPFATSAGGYRVRICLRAQVTELRVPQSPRELLQFRRRRGAAYLAELLSSENGRVSVSWRLARFMRLWHFRVMPKTGAVLMISSLVLLCTPFWSWPLLASALFIISALVVLFVSSASARDEYRVWKLIPASVRLLLLTFISMLTLNTRPQVRGLSRGGS